MLDEIELRAIASLRLGGVSQGSSLMEPKASTEAPLSGTESDN
jgi:hypothetical protein